MTMIEAGVKKFVDRRFDQQAITETRKYVPLYFRNQMSATYKQDETTLQKIIKDFIKPQNDNASVILHIYYKSRKLQQLLIKNNPH